MLDVQVRGADKLRKVAAALREADKVGLKRKLGRAIKQAAGPTLDAVKESARSITTRGMRRPGALHPFDRVVAPKGTRRKIADAVTADVRISEDDPRVSFAVKNAKLPLELRNMPRKFDSGDVWRHPVMGNREAWVGQVGDPWFWPPIRDHIKDFRTQIDEALDATREEIERS